MDLQSIDSGLRFRNFLAGGCQIPESNPHPAIAIDDFQRLHLQRFGTIVPRRTAEQCSSDDHDKSR
jgi:hypothetical protein